jgi:hypothetical protein
MATIIHTSNLAMDAPVLRDPNKRLWIYNGLDCVVTRHVHDALEPLVEQPGHAVPYRFVRAMQAPALDMMTRGICVNPLDRRKAQDTYTTKRERLNAILQKLAHAVWGRELNHGSPKQLCAFFYTALKMKPQYALRKTPEGKVRTLSCDHKALETLAKEEVRGPGVANDRNVEKVHLARPFVTLILAIRDCDKKLSVLANMRERFYCAYGVATTVTARWSSFANAFGDGTNLQNITPEMRRPCCADEGKKMATFDLEQAESRFVAALTWAATGDDRYWKACESGDLHTVVCTMSWTEKFEQFGRWSDETGKFEGDLKAARVVAEQKWYRHLSHRDGAKRIGHGSNYWGSPVGIAMMIGDVEPRVTQEFQTRYFRAFPAIRNWHNHTIRTIQQTNALWTPLGRKRIFFGRTTDDSTLREGIAHVPQSSIGELLNYMLYRVWRYGIDGGTVTTPNGQVWPFRNVCQLLLQVHDSISIQYPDRPDIEAAVIAKVTELMTVDIPITRPPSEDGSRAAETRMLRVPTECQIGWNWAKQDEKRETFPDGNPDGHTKWRGPGSDKRRRTTPARPTARDWLGPPG